MTDLILALDLAGFNIMDLLMSKTAIIIYAAVLAVLLIALMISLIFKDSKGPKKIQANVSYKQSDDKSSSQKTSKTSDSAPEALPVVQAVPSAQTPAVTDKNKKADKKKETEGVGRFCMLTDIEKRKDSFLRESYDENVTLKDFCDSFRAFAASRMRLYYDIEDIRRFVAGMGVSHILILQGMSGTGKTSLAHAFGAFVENPSTIIAVQPMWKERTDLVGY